MRKLRICVFSIRREARKTCIDTVHRVKNSRTVVVVVVISGKPCPGPDVVWILPEVCELVGEVKVGEPGGVLPALIRVVQHQLRLKELNQDWSIMMMITRMTEITKNRMKRIIMIINYRMKMIIMIIIYG